MILTRARKTFIVSSLSLLAFANLIFASATFTSEVTSGEQEVEAGVMGLSVEDASENSMTWFSPFPEHAVPGDKYHYYAEFKNTGNIQWGKLSFDGAVDRTQLTEEPSASGFGLSLSICDAEWNQSTVTCPGNEINVINLSPSRSFAQHVNAAYDASVSVDQNDSVYVHLTVSAGTGNSYMNDHMGSELPPIAFKVTAHQRTGVTLQ